MSARMRFLVATLLLGGPIVGRAQDAEPPRTIPYRWRFGIGAIGQSESNARFIERNAVSDMLTRVGADVAGSLGSERTRVQLSGSGDVVRYRTLRDLDRKNYDVGVTLSREATSRLSFEADVRMRVASSLDTQVGVDDGDVLLLPFTRSRTQSVSSRASYVMTPRTEVSAEGAYMKTRFDESAFSGGELYSGRLSVRRRYSTQGSIALVSDVNSIATADQTISGAAIGAEWARAGGRVEARVRAGASGLHSTEADRSAVVLMAEAELRHRQGAGTYALRGSSGALQAFGLGRPLMMQVLGMSYDRIAWSATALRASVDHGWVTDPTASGLSLQTSTLLAEVRQPVRRGLSLSTGIFYRRRSQELVIDNRGLYVSASMARGR